MAARREGAARGRGDGGPFVFMARINFYRAVYRDTPPPIGNPEGKKSRNWGKRKLARDS
jgi:hypothetical protein